MTSNKKVFVPLLAVLRLTLTIGTAYAITDTEDKNHLCGNNYWGEREYQNDFSGDDVVFGKTWQCNNLASFEGRYNTAKITTEMTGNPSQYDIAYSAAYQGTTPWDKNADQDGGAVNDNTAFPLDSDPSSDYNLKTQWVWTQTGSPNSSNDSIYANFLTNLWFTNDVTGTNPDKYFVVIDFLYDQLEEDGTSGDWKQRTVWDTEWWIPGTQYYDIFCNEDPDGNFIYHCNVVLDNSGTSAGTWNEYTGNIDSYIDDAFSESYDQTNGCNDSTPGNRGDFDLVDQESGIELQAQESGATGKVIGGYSFSELWH